MCGSQRPSLCNTASLAAWITSGCTSPPPLSWSVGVTVPVPQAAAARSVVDTWVADEVRVINPLAIDGFQCEVCRFPPFPPTCPACPQSSCMRKWGTPFRAELPNAYFHCLGCEVLRTKDFNTCVSCYRAGLWKVNTGTHTDSGSHLTNLRSWALSELCVHLRVRAQLTLVTRRGPSPKRSLVDGVVTASDPVLCADFAARARASVTRCSKCGFVFG